LKTKKAIYFKEKIIFITKKHKSSLGNFKHMRSLDQQW